MGKYISNDVVASFLESKVSFGSGDDQISEMELNYLIKQAESKVEMELSDQYVIPFRGYDGLTYDEIPSTTTKEIISSICLYRSLYNVMKYYFGKTSNNRGQNYLDFYNDSYHDLIDPLKRKRNTGVFDVPPLEGLFINGNSQRVSPVLPSPQVASCGVNSLMYANTHMNNPQVSPLFVSGYWSGGCWVSGNCSRKP